MKGIRVLIDGKEKVIILEERACFVCGNFFQPLKRKTKYCSNSCWRKDYYRTHLKQEHEYKDKIRHGSRKSEFIKATGLVCSTCGKVGNSFEIIAHHKTFNNKEHEQQELLCRACHCRLHHAVEKKPVTREQIEEAIKNSGNLFEACNKLGLNRSSLYQKRRKLGLL